MRLASRGNDGMALRPTKLTPTNQCMISKSRMTLDVIRRCEYLSRRAHKSQEQVGLVVEIPIGIAKTRNANLPLRLALDIDVPWRDKSELQQRFALESVPVDPHAS
jgi:hypothetical protein